MPKQKRRSAEDARANARVASEHAAARKAQERIEDTEASACIVTGRRVDDSESTFDSGWRLSRDAPRTPRETVAHLIDADVTSDEAAAAVETAGVTLWYRDRDGTEATDPGDSEPFSWVSVADVDAMRQAVDEHRTKDRPRPWIGGRGCGWCGVRRSPQWFTPTFRFPDRQQAVLCAECFAAYDRAGQPAAYGDDWRCALLKRITGYVPDQFAPVVGTVRAYCEIERTDYSGVGASFEWVPRATVAELHVLTWGAHPRGAPDRTAARRWARLHRLRAAQAERQQREAAAEREQAVTALRW